MKNPPSPRSSFSSSTPFPSPDISRLSPNPTEHSSPEVDHNGSPIRKRERVRSFVKSLRRTSSQLFKKDKESRKSSSTISSDAPTAATTPGILRRFSHSKQSSMSSSVTAQSDLSESYLDLKGGSDKGSIILPVLEIDAPSLPAPAKPADPAPMSPLNETPNEEEVSPETEPKGVQNVPLPVDPTTNEEGSLEPTETPLGDSDPLHFPLPPSPSPPSSPFEDSDDEIHIIVVSDREDEESDDDSPYHDDEVTHDDQVTHDDEVIHDDAHTATRNDMVTHDDAITHDGAVASNNPDTFDGVTNHVDPAPREDPVPHEDPAPRDNVAPPRDDNPVPHDDAPLHTDGPTRSEPDLVQPPAAVDIDNAPTTSSPHHISQSLPSLSSPASGLATDREKEDKEMRELCIPVVIPPMLFWPISNMRLSIFFTPVLTWWLSKGVLSYPHLYS